MSMLPFDGYVSARIDNVSNINLRASGQPATRFELCALDEDVKGCLIATVLAHRNKDGDVSQWLGLLMSIGFKLDKDGQVTHGTEGEPIATPIPVSFIQQDDVVSTVFVGKTVYAEVAHDTVHGRTFAVVRRFVTKDSYERRRMAGVARLPMRPVMVGEAPGDIECTPTKPFVGASVPSGRISTKPSPVPIPVEAWSDRRRLLAATETTPCSGSVGVLDQLWVAGDGKFVPVHHDPAIPVGTASTMTRAVRLESPGYRYLDPGENAARTEGAEYDLARETGVGASKWCRVDRSDEPVLSPTAYRAPFDPYMEHRKILAAIGKEGDAKVEPDPRLLRPEVTPVPHETYHADLDPLAYREDG